MNKIKGQFVPNIMNPLSVPQILQSVNMQEHEVTVTLNFKQIPSSWFGDIKFKRVKSRFVKLV